MTTASPKTATAPQQSTAARLEAAEQALREAIAQRDQALQAGNSAGALAASHRAMGLRNDVRGLTAQLQAEVTDAALRAEMDGQAAAIAVAPAALTPDELGQLQRAEEERRQAAAKLAAWEIEDRRARLAFQAQGARNAAAAPRPPSVEQALLKWQHAQQAYAAAMSRRNSLSGERNIVLQERSACEQALLAAEERGDAGEIERIMPRLASATRRYQTADAQLAEITSQLPALEAATKHW